MIKYKNVISHKANKLKNLLTFTAINEFVTGPLLLALPSIPAILLLGHPSILLLLLL